MKKEHRELLIKCQPQLIQSIVSSRCLEDLLGHLTSQSKHGNDGLTPSNIRKIREEKHTHEDDMVKMFLDVLCTKSEVAYNRFINIIIDNNQTRLINILNSELPSDPQIRNESSTLAASTSSTLASSRKRRTPLDDNQEGFSDIFDSRRIESEKAMPAELTMPSTSSSSIHESFTQDNRDNKGNQMNGGNFEGAIFNQQIYNYAPPSREAPSSSSSVSSQPSAEDWQQKLATAKHSLKEIYLTRFQEVRPFSLPFQFHIENTWVSLALKEEQKNSKATEDHAELLKRAFDKAKMLIIEGNPATGKTSLMRRVAYEWAKGNKQLQINDLVLCAEFREVRKKTFKSICDLVLCYTKKYMSTEGYENLEKLVNNEKFSKECRILVLLDGYDESLLEKQCVELSSYINDKMIKKALLFETVITTRKGYLSTHRGFNGRYVFAEVLGFTTMAQKETYIFKHFYSQEIDDKESIAAVQSLLNNNENMNKLAETPLFLTFICLVHERIVDGTLLELYCNIIWWLIDRHQQDFPDRDIPALFGFQHGSSDNFETIQDHFLHFPQLYCLGKMALHNLEENVFKPSDCAQYNLQPIIEQVGLLRKEKIYDNSFKIITSLHFPHRTIQEFLAAFYCFCSNDPTSEWLLPDSILDTSETGTNEFERFLFRIALSDSMPIQAEKRKYYFEKITDISLDMRFDAFNTTAGFNYKLQNWFLSQCTNLQNISLNGTDYDRRHARTTWNVTSEHDVIPGISSKSLPALSLSDVMKLHSVTFNSCIFDGYSQLSFKNCPSLKNMQLRGCVMKRSINLAIATLPAIDTLAVYNCTFDTATWQSIAGQIKDSSVKFLKLSADFFQRKYCPEMLNHLQICECIQQISVRHTLVINLADDIANGDRLIHIFNCSAEEIVANLAQTAQKLKGLMIILISDENDRRLPEHKRLGERDKELIEKAGQERNPDFSIKYVE